MRILFINRLAGTLIGGGENFILQWMPVLQKRGHSVELLTARPLSGEGTPLPPEVELHTVRSPYLRYFGVKHKLPRPLPGIFLMLDFWCFRFVALRRLKHLLKKSSFDLVVLTGFPSFGKTIERTFKIPCVVRMPGPPGRMDIRALQQVSGVVANGDAYRQIQPLSVRRLLNLPPGIAAHFFEKQSVDSREALRQKHHPQEKIVFLFVGRFVSIKNIPLLLKAFQPLSQANPKVELRLVGQGEEQAKLERLIEELHIKDSVQFIPPQYGEDLVKQYQMSDVFVLSSFYDNFPQVVNEAMASGLPVVATDVGGLSLQVQPGKTGLLVPLNDLPAFQAALKQMAENSEQRATFGRAGQAMVRSHRWEAAAESFEAFATSILSSS